VTRVVLIHDKNVTCVGAAEMSGPGPSLPQLRAIPLSEIPKYEDLPRPRIRTDRDVETWKKTRSYQDYAIFLRHLNEAVVGHYLPRNTTCPSHVIIHYTPVFGGSDLVSGYHETSWALGHVRWLDR